MSTVKNFAVAFDINKKSLEARIFSWMDGVIREEYRRQSTTSTSDGQQVQRLFDDVARELNSPRFKVARPQDLQLDIALASGGEVKENDFCDHNKIAIEGYENKPVSYKALFERSLAKQGLNHDSLGHFNFDTRNNGRMLLGAISNNLDLVKELEHNDYMSLVINTKGTGMQSAIYDARKADIKNYHNGEYGHEVMPHLDKYKTIEGEPRIDGKNGQAGTAEPYLSLAEGAGIEATITHLKTLDKEGLNAVAELLQKMTGIQVAGNKLMAAFQMGQLKGDITNEKFYSIAAGSNVADEVKALHQFMAMRYAHFVASSIKKELTNSKTKEPREGKDSVFVALSGDGSRAILSTEATKTLFNKILKDELADTGIKTIKHGIPFNLGEEPEMRGADVIAKNIMAARVG